MSVRRKATRQEIAEIMDDFRNGGGRASEEAEQHLLAELGI